MKAHVPFHLHLPPMLRIDISFLTDAVVNMACSKKKTATMKIMKERKTKTKIKRIYILRDMKHAKLNVQNLI